MKHCVQTQSMLGCSFCCCCLVCGEFSVFNGRRKKNVYLFTVSVRLVKVNFQFKFSSSFLLVFEHSLRRTPETFWLCASVLWGLLLIFIVSFRPNSRIYWLAHKHSQPNHSFCFCPFVLTVKRIAQSISILTAVLNSHSSNKCI